MSDNKTECEAAQRYPDNPHLDYTPMYAQLKREGFAAGAEWQRAADAAEIARLRAEADGYGPTLDRQSALLRGVADVLNGPPPPLTLWSHHDLPELAAKLVAERDALAQQIAAAEATIARMYDIPIGLLRQSEAAAIIAAVVRRSCTITSELASPKSDATIAFVADWIEDPPAWVDAPWRRSPVTPESETN